jgi:signal transduction histidine kinase
MKKNLVLQKMLKHVVRLTDSNWAGFAFLQEGKWIISGGSVPRKTCNQLTKVVNVPRHCARLISSIKKRRVSRFSSADGEESNLCHFSIFPINETACILVGDDSMTPPDIEMWKSMAAVADILSSQEDQTSRLQEALQELENLQQEVQARVAAQQAAESRLIRTTKLAAVGEMAAGVAHELNNPLTTVVGFSELVLESLPPDSPQQEDMEVVLKEARRARDVVRRLLDFSRQSETRRAKADLNELIRDVLSLMQHMFHINGVTITTLFDQNLPWVLIDRNQMKQVFLNLFHNSLNAMPEGGELVIETRSSSRYGAPFASVEIKDSGEGIPPENLPRIFEPFFTTRADQGGTGLGLSVTFGIVSEHGGAIEVESIPGEGSTFTVFLPLDGER